MNKKRFLSMVLSAALVITLFPASAGAATVKQDVTLTGNINVVNPIYDIIIPTNLDFEVDSFGIFSENPQSIISTGYAIVNRSPMAVKVDINASLTSASSGALEFKDEIADVSTEDETNTNPELYFELRPATTAPIVTSGAFAYTAVTPGSVNITSAAMGWDVSPSALTYASGQAIDATTGNSVSFVMAKSPNATEMTPGEIGYTVGHEVSDDAIAFKFDGAVNPYAEWEQGDLANFKVVALFSFNAMTPKGYDTAKADLSDAKGHGYLGTSSAADAIPTYSKASANNVVLTNVVNTSATITAVQLKDASGANLATPGTNFFTLSPSARTITIAGNAGFWGNYTESGNSYKLQFTFSNSQKEEFTVKVTN